jgi:hypothetical protein
VPFCSSNQWLAHRSKYNSMEADNIVYSMLIRCWWWRWLNRGSSIGVPC